MMTSVQAETVACAGALGWLWALNPHKVVAGVRTADVPAQSLMTEVLQVGNGLCQPVKPLVGYFSRMPPAHAHIMH